MDFMLKTYFRHFSLYEYSFKPKVDLLLMTVPKEYTQTHESVKGASAAKATERSMEQAMDSLDVVQDNMEA